jgi:uncharacterized protein (DUF4213/DUF364 family)
MGSVVNEMLSLVYRMLPEVGEIRVNRVCIGVGYTGVKLENGCAGVCQSLLSEQISHCWTVRDAGRLAGETAASLANLAKSWRVSESVVGVATLNALSQMLLDRWEGYVVREGNLFNYIRERVGGDDIVGVVGYIRPFVNILQKKVKRLYVFERNPMLFGEHVLPDTACEDLLPEADVVIVSGTAIANKTIDHVLRLSQGAREIGVVGPSACLIPEPLFKRGVTVIGGVKAVNADRLLEIIMEGGGTPQIKPTVKFVNILQDVDEKA